MKGKGRKIRMLIELLQDVFCEKQNPYLVGWIDSRGFSVCSIWGTPSHLQELYEVGFLL